MPDPASPASPKRSKRKLNERCLSPAGRLERLNDALRQGSTLTALLICALFVALASGILWLRADVVPYRPSQVLRHDVVARADFDYYDARRWDDLKLAAREATPRVFRYDGGPLDELRTSLAALPTLVAKATLDGLDPPLRGTLDGATLVALQEFAEPARSDAWQQSVSAYVDAVRALRLPIVDDAGAPGEGVRLGDLGVVPVAETLPPRGPAIAQRLADAASKNFSNVLWPKVRDLTVARLGPLYVADPAATALAQNAAAASVPPDRAHVRARANQVIVAAGTIDDAEYALLKAEHAAFRRGLGSAAAWQRVGTVLGVALVTAAGAAYVGRYQRRIVRNQSRALGLIALLLATLLVAQLAAVGTGQIYLYGLTPTVFATLVLAIAYDGRFALGIGGLHAVLVTLALAAPLPFYLVLFAGVATVAFMAGELRTRSRLIEIGGAAGVVMMLATSVQGLLAAEAPRYALVNAAYAGCAGFAAGFITLGVIPLIERAFRMTTGMTLLELADLSHPLLRKLAAEAPGTYSHSLQVATLVEAAAEAIGADGLLCRVGAYYHDVGKMNKADYFVENQTGGAQSRHLNLSPSVSLLIIVGHVKDGVELAREYRLPTVLTPFIQSHHGTTLVEYFYHQAEQQRRANIDVADGPATPPEQYRYPGPRPRSREVALLMICDAAESACRAVVTTARELTASRIEGVVGELIMKRLTDGQFDECELTMRDLATVEKTLTRLLISVYHGRIAYPTESAESATRAEAQARIA